MNIGTTMILGMLMCVIMLIVIRVMLALKK